MTGLTLTVVAADIIDQTNETVDSVLGLAEFINRYGFMIVFSAVTFVVLIVFFFYYIRRISRKEKNENDILIKERTASIEQDQKIFDLVTTVQTEQVSQLRQMTVSLQEMNKSILDTDAKVMEASLNLDRIRDSIKICGEQNHEILDVVKEVLEFVKKSDKDSGEILAKVNALEDVVAFLKNDINQKN